MRKLLFLLILLSLEKGLHAQYVYTIKADSVKITNTCDTAELIIENHTQTVPGFLFNKGRGRTEFRRGLLKISDSIYIVGGDTLRMNPWLQGGNRFGTTGSFGTMDNNHIDFYTNSQQRGRWTNTGNLLIGNGSDLGFKLQLHEKGSVVFSPKLSRPNDIIMFGGYMNPDDGQNMIISTSDGTTGHAVLMEREGNIGMGWGSPTGWNVGHPTFRINANGTVSIASTNLYFGQTGGPVNSSALVTSVSSGTEWQDGGAYPNGANNYYFGTTLQTPTPGYSRAPLFMGAKYLTFSTGVNDIEAMRIAQSGNVLIGTTNDIPGVRFHMVGNFIQEPPATAIFGNTLAFDMWGDAARLSCYRKMVYQSHNLGDQHLFVNSVGSYFTGTLVTIDPGYYPNMPDSQVALKVRTKFSTENASGFIVNMAGRVGIGTETPSAQLHATGTVRFGGLANDNSLARIVVSDANGNLYYRDASSLALNETINSDLAVNGRVSAQKMVITQTGRWPDYVFSKQYTLPSLSEVESFIKQNNHLPGIPSAAEVEKKGIDVASNEASLLKKIEELTLYTIQQDKELKSLKQEMAELKTLIKEKR